MLVKQIKHRPDETSCLLSLKDVPIYGFPV